MSVGASIVLTPDMAKIPEDPDAKLLTKIVTGILELYTVLPNV